jgi:hypothetical protein
LSTKPSGTEDLPEKSEEWRVHTPCSPFSGFTLLLAAEMQKVGGSLVDLKQLKLLGR